VLIAVVVVLLGVDYPDKANHGHYRGSQPVLPARSRHSGSLLGFNRSTMRIKAHSVSNYNAMLFFVPIAATRRLPGSMVAGNAMKDQMAIGFSTGR
jgi:hypothetical protein